MQRTTHARARVVPFSDLATAMDEVVPQIEAEGDPCAD